MFKTIRAKISLIVGITLFALIIALSIFSLVYFQGSKPFFIDAYYRSISDAIQIIERSIVKIEDNARDMAIFGEIFYQMPHNQKTLDKFVLKIITDYRESLSGGIWYEPYTINPHKELYSSFAYLNKNSKVVLNYNYNNQNNSYLKSIWYDEIVKELSNGKEVAWSAPYYETNGVNAFMVTAGVGIYDEDKLIGISTADWEIDSIIEEVLNIKPTPNSFLLFADEFNDYVLVSTDKNLDNEKLLGKSLSEIPWYSKDKKSTFTYNGKKYVSYIKDMTNGMILIVNIPENELYSRIIYRFVGLFSILIIFSIFLVSNLYFSLKKNILKPINKLTDLANKISKGNSDLSIKIDNPIEFAQLAKTFDKMTKDIKLITKKQIKLESELSIAKSIQSLSLPSTFPAYPDKKEFEIYASMTPTQKVGGDFYDFYFLDDHHLMFLIADVSGKGIPAALFMMKIKTLISNISLVQYTPKELIELINKKVCESNKEGYFVTLLACIIDINTGDISFINCGHTPPLIKHENGDYEYFDLPSNIVLGAFENSKYTIVETTLEVGDRLFLYTDGITETINQNNELFGEENLKTALNNNKELSLTDTLNKIKTKVYEYANGMNQSDDITMLIFEYKGSPNVVTFKDLAIQENYKHFYPMLYNAAAAWKLDEELAGKIYMCAEELFANVVFYAYPTDNKGLIEIEMTNSEKSVSITFMDEGYEYNPLEKEDPDITLPPDQRPVGGLGIFMVKQMASDITYQRVNNKNIITLVFKKDFN